MAVLSVHPNRCSRQTFVARDVSCVYPMDRRADARETNTRESELVCEGIGSSRYTIRLGIACGRVTSEMCSVNCRYNEGN